MYSYCISGLHVSSELELQGAIPDASGVQMADVTIRRGAVPMTLDGATASGPTWQMWDDIILLRIPRLTRCLVTAGRDIAVEIEPGATDRDAASFVLGYAFGVLLHQRGTLVLHGAAVAKNGRAIAICGASGAGKSTLAAALCREGCAFVTDDICVIGQDTIRRPTVLPDGRKLKLWKQSIDRLDLAQLRGEAVRESLDKYFIDPSKAPGQASPLAAIYVLRWARPKIRWGIERLALPDAVRAIDYEGYRPGTRTKIGQKPKLLAHAAAMLGYVKMFLLFRPRGFRHLQETVAAVQAHWDALD